MNATTRRSYYGIALLLSVLAIAVASMIEGARLTGAAPEQADLEALGHAKALSRAFHVAAQRVLPAVVLIQQTIPAPERQRDEASQSPSKKNPLEEFFSDPLLRRFFEKLPSAPRSPEVNLGSGVVIDGSGIILTDHHVVAGGGTITVRLHDGREFDAVDIKSDPKTDVAVIRIEGAGSLEPAVLGDSDALQTGDWVLAIGAPFGLEETVTAGIVSAKNRGLGLTAREDFLQTDAAMNPGNSGGPLIDVEGRVVGLNTAISTRSGGYQGVGFAVPIKLARWVSEQLIQHGAVRRAYLGVGIQSISSDLAEQFKIKTREGALVSEVFSNTPGSEAGLQPGDVIVAFAGVKVLSSRELQTAVEKAEIGSSVPVEIVRDGKSLTLHVKLQEQPTEYGEAQPVTTRPAEPAASEFKELGISVNPLDRDAADRLGIKEAEGMLIKAVQSGSLAELAGLQADMVIVQVNGRPVATVDDFRTAIKDQPLEKGVLLLVRTAEGSRFFVLKKKGGGRE